MEQKLILFPCFLNASDGEIEVANIQIHLSHMISELETPLPIPLELIWGYKGTRSILTLKDGGGASTLRRLIGPDFLCSLQLWASLAPQPSAAKAPPLPQSLMQSRTRLTSPCCHVASSFSAYDTGTSCHAAGDYYVQKIPEKAPPQNYKAKFMYRNMESS